MKMIVKRIEYYEWELHSELIELLEKDRDNATPEQNLVEEFFNVDDISVVDIGDCLYRFVELKEI